MEVVKYEEFYRNVNNKNWSGWKNLGEVMTEVERQGSKSFKYSDSKVKHALNFLNSWLLETRVKDVLGLQFFGDDHDGIYPRRGDANKPDFIDEKGITYELKERWNLDEAYNIYWGNCDACLLHIKGINVLYRYYPETGEAVKICNLRAAFVNIKNYRFTDADLGIE